MAKTHESGAGLTRESARTGATPPLELSLYTDQFNLHPSEPWKDETEDTAELHYALGAASWRAREWLGWNAALDEGAPADFVVYPRDPLTDLSVLREPSRIVLRGKVVA